VIVTGTGNFVKVRIRGDNSIKIDSSPLYVVNNVNMGRDYAQVNNVVNTADIVSVRILRSYHEVTSYGELGRNGVILIKTRSGNDDP
jgi:hypothetical protein